MNLQFAFSTCPNDTFMFEAIVNQRIDLNDFTFNVHLADIEELNKQAHENINDITKISFNAYAALTPNYQILTSGAALGFGNGPLIISKHKIYPDELRHAKIAIPGKETTANLLLTILFPEVKNKKSYLFSDIEEAILSNEVDAGLIIHETRFSYQKRGLKIIADLGVIWEENIELPLPLGGIAIKRDLPGKVKTSINQIIAESVSFALENPTASLDFVKKHARDLNENVIRKHIDLYVNKFSIHCGKKGQNAIMTLINKAAELNKTDITEPVFL